MDGIVTNQWTTDGWNNLNDGNVNTMAQTNAIRFSYMELDLGEGGKQTDRVRVYHSGGRLNNVTLYVMDDKRKIIMSQYFTGITETSPRSLEFMIPMAESINNIPESDTKMVQILRLTRISPGINWLGLSDNFMNEVSLEAYLGSRANAYFASVHMPLTVSRH